MFDRRNTAPLLSTKVSGGNGGISLSKITPCHVLATGILVGITLGLFVSTSLLTRIHKTASDIEPGLNTADFLPTIKEGSFNRRIENEIISTAKSVHDNQQSEEKKISEEITVSKETVVEGFEAKEVAEKTDDETDIKFLLNEGTRELTEFEKHGGWRFRPIVLKISEHFPNAQILSESSPRLVLFKNFLTAAEVEHVLNLANDHLTRSKVVGGKDEGKSEVRTSYGAWLTGRLRDETVQEIERRIHNAVGIPHSFGEGIYVLRYEQTQKYNPHTDNCARAGEVLKDSCLGFLKRNNGPECGEGHGGASCGDRIATFIMYLRTPEKGGQTIFPQSSMTMANLKKVGRKSMSRDFKDICQNPYYFKVQPEPGDAVLFWNYVPRLDIDNHDSFVRSGNYEHRNQSTEAYNDNTALHGGCPVLEGQKWIATKWIRSTLFS